MVEHPVTAVLEMNGLTVRFATPEGEVSAVNELNLLVGPGERLAVVGDLAVFGRLVSALETVQTALA